MGPTFNHHWYQFLEYLPIYLTIRWYLSIAISKFDYRRSIAGVGQSPILGGFWASQRSGSSWFLQGLRDVSMFFHVIFGPSTSTISGSNPPVRLQCSRPRSPSLGGHQPWSEPWTEWDSACGGTATGPWDGSSLEAWWCRAAFPTGMAGKGSK